MEGEDFILALLLALHVDTTNGGVLQRATRFIEWASNPQGQSERS
jgi:hypothetical protein